MAVVMSVSTKTVKCLVNSVDNAVTETLFGLSHTYPQLEYNPPHKVVIAPEVEKRTNKVSLLCGGGSGHEPFAAGFVGSGMLTASIAGSIFAAPPSVHITYAIQRVAQYSKAGILMIIPNYTGDCLNFGIAIEKARQSGLMISDVIIADDCSIPKNEQGIAGERGLTGMLFVIKIAGALAERGLPLQEVTEVARNVSRNMATYGVGLTPCALPGQGFMFELADDEIECGMGVHGEAGCEKMKMASAKEVTSFILKRIRDSLSLTSGDSVAVLVNNFGAMSQLEQGIVVHEVVQQLRSSDVQPVRVYSGVLMTSLNSSGVHITLLKLPVTHKNCFLSCLDDPTNAPRWPGSAYSVPLTSGGTSLQEEVKGKVEKVGVEINVKEQRLIKQCVGNACNAIIEKESYLNDLDRGCGDGDCGSTLRRLAEGILEHLDTFHLSHPASVFSTLANIAEEAMGGTSGALYCLFFTAVAKEIAGAQQKEKWLNITARAFRSGLACLMKYGKANPGDRSMIDAMDDACATYENLLSKDFDSFYEEIARAAWRGCEATKNMKPRAGRASYVKQTQYLQQVDAGAYAAATWISTVVNTILNFSG